MKKGVILFLALAALCLYPQIQARADLIQYVVPMDGLQEVPPNASPATGLAKVTLETTSNQLSWDITYQDLLGPLVASHFHGPAPPGVNAPVIVPIPIGPSPLVGDAIISDANEALFLSGLVYVNLHTTLFPGGEIRGQVVPVPASLLLLSSGILALAAGRKKFFNKL